MTQCCIENIEDFLLIKPRDVFLIFFEVLGGKQPITTQSKCDSLLAREPAIFKTCLLNVKRLKNMRSLNAFPLKYLSMKENK